jgi:hypothetical protein
LSTLFDQDLASVADIYLSAGDSFWASTPTAKGSLYSRDQAIRDIQALTRAGLLAPRGNATTWVYVLAGTATEVAQAASAAVRGPGRDPYQGA